jgi:hypothetical protein
MQPAAPADVPIGQPAVVVGGTVVIRPRDDHIAGSGTTMQPQVPQTQGQVYTLQPQPQYPVQLQPQNGQLPRPQHAVQPHVPLATLPQGNKPGIANTDPLAMVGGAITSVAPGAAGGDTGTIGSGHASTQ